MKLRGLERWLMNNPVRPLFQRHVEARQLLRMGGPQAGASVLEIGCGSGAGIELLLDAFKASQVHGFDLDPHMVRLAAARNRLRKASVGLWTGNAARIPAAHQTYDAVFDFGVLHHMIDWKPALREIHRVLRPGGRFYGEEITRQFIVHPIWRRLLDHPQENRFDQHDLATALADAGFTVRAMRQGAGLFIWCIADRT